MSQARPVWPTAADLALKAELEHRAEMYRRHRDKLAEAQEKAMLAGWSDAQIVAVTGGLK